MSPMEAVLTEIIDPGDPDAVRDLARPGRSWWSQVKIVVGFSNRRGCMNLFMCLYYRFVVRLLVHCALQLLQCDACIQLQRASLAKYIVTFSVNGCLCVSSTQWTKNPISSTIKYCHETWILSSEETHPNRAFSGCWWIWFWRLRNCKPPQVPYWFVPTPAVLSPTVICRHRVISWQGHHLCHHFHIMNKYIND